MDSQRMDGFEFWPHQRRGLSDVADAIALGHRRICYQAVTGSGKGAVIAELIKQAVEQDKRVALLTNRRLLIDQLSGVLNKQKIYHGLRAASYSPDLERHVQICSVQTEMSRSVKRQSWTLHDADLVLLDELHLNASESCQELQAEYLKKPGSVFIGFTATPLDVRNMADHLIIAGTKKECRECGALVYAKHYGPDEPDMQDFKQSVKTGEYQEGDVKKAIMTKNIFGRVWDNWTKLNPDQKPTLLFAPGVAESVWFAKQFRAKGIRSAHIDGEHCWLDGEEYPSSRDVREQILSDVRRGLIPVLTNRFCLREGIDLPMIECLILATVIGSLQAYLQIVGRGLRASPATLKKFLTIIDHGGHFWRHGSANTDREWSLDDVERIIQNERAERLREKKDKEPIRCPRCSMIRATGNVCPGCGFKHEKSTRIVIQQSGELVEHVGDVFKPHVVRYENDTDKLWKQCYWRCRKTGKTFTQAEGLFYRENGYWPPSDIALRPLNSIDRFKRIEDVPFSSLVQGIKRDMPVDDGFAGSLYQ